jgi:prevent-host-death family protein
MKVVNLHKAKTHLSRLVEEAANGDEITIAKAGKPIARLIAVEPSAPRVPGLLRGRIEMADDFDAPLPAGLLALFEGGAVAPVAKRSKARRKRA